MTPTRAKTVAAQILSICRKEEIWVNMSYEMKPDLKAIKINEISIKITEEDKRE